MKAVILAAGECSRFWPLAQDRHKSMYEVGDGRPILAYTLASLRDAGIEEFIIITRAGDPTISNFFGAGDKLSAAVWYVEQPEPLGMGEAILRTRQHLKANENFLVLNASQINAGQIIQREARALKLLKNRIILFGQKTNTPQKFGMMEIEHGRVRNIEEKPENFAGSSRILGVYAFPYWFLDDLEKFTGNHSLEEALRSVLCKEAGVQGIVLPPELSLPSLKFPWDLLTLNRVMMRAVLKSENTISLGEADIHHSAFIYGPVVIEGDVKVLEGAVIKGPCFIGAGAVIGNHSLVRDGSYIGRGVVVGAHSEVKNSLLYDGTTLHHNFIGDSILDRGSHLGAGTVTANSKFKNTKTKTIRSKINGQQVDTGREKLGLIMGADSSLGINVSTFPGIKIGKDVQVWPGTTIQDDIVDRRVCRQYGANLITPRGSA